MERELADLIRRMPLGASDPEKAHMLADRILIRAIRRMARGMDQEQEAERLIEAWRNIPKWYA